MNAGCILVQVADWCRLQTGAGHRLVQAADWCRLQVGAGCRQVLQVIMCYRLWVDVQALIECNLFAEPLQYVPNSCCKSEKKYEINRCVGLEDPHLAPNWGPPVSKQHFNEQLHTHVSTQRLTTGITPRWEGLFGIHKFYICSSGQKIPLYDWDQI